MGKKQQWAKRGMTALMAAAFLSTAPAIVLADHHEGMAEAAKGMVKDMATDAAAAATGAAEGQSPGQQAFNQYCASCHGTDAKGKGPVAETLKKEPADLTQISKKNGGEFNAGDVARMIDGQADVAGHGPREMPVWGVEFAENVSKANQGSAVGKSYARASIVQLVRYIESIQE